MLKDFYDDKTESIVKLEHFYGEQKHLVNKCLIIFSKVIHDHLLEEYECKEIALMGSCTR